MIRRYALRDGQWVRIAHLLPGRPGHVGGTAAGHRLSVDAALYRFRAGGARRDLPERFGKGESVHQRFGRRSGGGVRERAFAALGGEAGDEYAMIAAAIVRAHQHAAGARNKGATATRPSGAAGAGCARSSTRWWTRRAPRSPAT